MGSKRKSTERLRDESNSKRSKKVTTESMYKAVQRLLICFSHCKYENEEYGFDKPFVDIVGEDTDVDEIPPSQINVSCMSGAYWHCWELLMNYYNKNGIALNFPKDALKFYLATYQRVLTRNDFVIETKSVRGEKKISNGTILQYYLKSLDLFISNISKIDDEDLMALKLIMDRGIKLPITLYVGTISALKNVFTPTYSKVARYDKELFSTHHQINTCNGFRTNIIYVNPYTILTCDGNHMGVSNSLVEKELHSGCSIYYDSDYGIYEILINGSKIRVLDVIYDSRKSTDVKELSYEERLDICKEAFPNKIVDISTDESDENCILKPKMGFEGLTYQRSAHVGAVIGLEGRNAVVALLTDEGKLKIDFKCSISAPLLVHILTAVLSKRKNEEKTIAYNETVYEIEDDLSEINVFKELIPVEYKENCKIGNITHHPISKLSECKSSNPTNDQFNYFKKELEKSPELLKKVTEYFATLSKNSNINVDFDAFS